MRRREGEVLRTDMLRNLACIEENTQNIRKLSANSAAEYLEKLNDRIAQLLPQNGVDPQRLAQHRNAKCKYDEGQIAAALTGNYRREHLFALGQAVELYDMYGQQLVAVDAEMAALYDQMQPPDAGQPTTTPPKKNRPKRRKNQAHFDLTAALYRLTGVDLTQIDGIDALTAQAVITEVGFDMSKWPSEKHFTSWLGLCPNNQITGGQVKRRRTKKTDNRATTALRVAAQSVARSHTALGAFYRRMKARHGPAKAIVATAHKLARIIYHMLKYRVDYADPGADFYDEQQRQRAIKRLHRQAAKLGFQVEALTVVNHA